MQARTAVIVFITGAVLTFAIRSHPAGLDVGTAGVVLMITGGIGLWPYGGKAWVLLSRAWLHHFVDQVRPCRGSGCPSTS